jgi:hypothetical protein
MPELAERRWTELLDRHPDSGVRLAEQQIQRGLVSDGQPLCTVSRPVMMTSADLERQRRIVRLLVRALRRARDHVVAHRATLPGLGRYRDWIDELLALEVADVDHGEVIRLDTFADDGSLHVVEANCDIPGGTGHADGIAELFEGLPFWPQFSHEHGARIVALQPHLFATLAQAWRAWGRGGTEPRLGVIGWRGRSAAVDDIMRLTTEAAEAAGFHVRCAEVAELEWHPPRLLAAGEPVDLVFRVMLSEWAVDDLAALRPLTEALRHDAVCMVNSFRSELMGHKSLMALLTDPEIDLGLLPDERAVVDQHVPWGRVVSDRTTSGPDGTTIDLLDWMEAEQQHLVIKPTHSARGHGVVLGWEADEAGWREAIDRAADADHVVQRRVHLPVRSFPLLDGSSTAEFLEDTDPFVFDGEIATFMSRLSRGGGLTNVSAGASLTPTVIVD